LQPSLVGRLLCVLPIDAKTQGRVGARVRVRRRQSTNVARNVLLVQRNFEIKDRAPMSKTPWLSYTVLATTLAAMMALAACGGNETTDRAGSGGGGGTGNVGGSASTGGITTPGPQVGGTPAGGNQSGSTLGSSTPGRPTPTVAR
jgi:hypothetical protein